MGQDPQGSPWELRTAPTQEPAGQSEPQTYNLKGLSSSNNHVSSEDDPAVQKVT